MYWLKPFDAVNDTANAMSLLNFDWSKGREPILEIGGGDGVFSFIMHGGSYIFSNDRYSQTDPAVSGDIYDVYDERYKLSIKKEADIQYDLGIDLKSSHILKARETGLYKNDQLISSYPEQLPVADKIFSTVFLYTFHGLTDYEKTLLEIKRVIKEDGCLYLLGFNDAVKHNFVCYNLAKYFHSRGKTRIARYFADLDGGRYEEIGLTFSKSYAEWECLFMDTGFSIEKVYTQVSPRLWRIYDTQTRPWLRPMIRSLKYLDKVHLRTVIKALWMGLWLPLLTFSYYISAHPIEVKGKKPRGVFLAFCLIPVDARRP